MTQDQQIALAHWSRWGSDGFPIAKRGRGWWVAVDSTSLWRVITSGCPKPFHTKTEAIEWFDELCLNRAREWRAN